MTLANQKEFTRFNYFLLKNAIGHQVPTLQCQCRLYILNVRPYFWLQNRVRLARRSSHSIHGGALLGISYHSDLCNITNTLRLTKLQPGVKHSFKAVEKNKYISAVSNTAVFLQLRMQVLYYKILDLRPPHCFLTSILCLIKVCSNSEIILKYATF